MSRGLSRRKFLQTTGAVAGAALLGNGLPAFAGPSTVPSTSPNKLRVGIIGVSHRGGENLRQIANLSDVARIIALCDTDASQLGVTAKTLPDATTYRDFRRMLEQQKDLDAVVISTPDHTHAVATVMALKSGKHVYCEKPLTHTIHEARVVRETARAMKRVTQMGTQIHAGANYRRVVELIRGGAIGAVSEAHVFCSKNWGAVPLPATTATVPDDVDYDVWQGPVAKSFRPEYMHGGWRRWYTFGNGTLGDMGCHYMDLPFWALDLTAPTAIRAQGAPVDHENCPQALTVHYDFPANGSRGPIKLSWYDGDAQPEHYADWNISARNGVVFVGEKGELFANYDSHALLPAEKFKDFKPPAPTIASSVGHHREWVQACLGHDMKATTCNFDYAGPLSETVLLGTVAYRSGSELNWDAEKCQITNNSSANELLQVAYREGWSL
ncbi:MAG TPA: Gfo/Idh/MocA family oxidoreductase [Tepidisphaeraceae bacterium]|jgi:predicted dehydrogenase|nr:Gfo/Idh/MocA family oxidoreductase [Tepidisphaeraceae bacterium]